MASPDFLLASASPRRREILRAAGYRFAVAPTGVPEADEGRFLSGVETALFNASAKARAAVALGPDCPVLAADTVVDLAGRLLGKPADLDEARAMLGLLSGRTHLVTTALVLWVPDGGPEGRFHAAHQTTRVQFHHLDGGMIERYISEVNPLDKAGAYGAQETSSVRLIRSIEGPLDNVYGLPLETASRLLAAAGIRPAPSRKPRRTRRARAKKNPGRRETGSLTRPPSLR